MEPTLTVLTGPRQGETLAVAGGDFTIGRQADNALPLQDPAVSRHHCVLRPAAGGLELVDLGSRHGTRVNGVAVGTVALAHGDVVAVGETSLLVLLAELPAPVPPLRLEDRPFSETAMEMPASEALAGQLAALGAAAGSTRVLQALLELPVALGAERGVEAVARRLLRQVLELLPAERAAVLLADATAEDFAPAVVEPAAASEPISRTVTRRVLERGVAVLSNDPLSGELEHAASVHAAGLRSLLCVPLPGAGRPLGVLYADSRRPRAAFTEEHLQLLATLGTLAATALDSALRIAALERENQRLQGAGDGLGLVGESAPLARIRQLIARAAPTDSTVLILGESGTGKELVARALHQASPRSGGPFVAINSATLSETLLESELFGHERGAFTGAVLSKPGKLELADGGTLFLDEIGELPLALQAKLLRVLEQRQFERVGGTRPIRVNLRLIAATNRDLKQGVEAGTVRADLYYRLNVITLTLPPLRERRGDVPLLAEHFLHLHSRKVGRHILGFSPAARACLQGYAWPGNVRELSNAVERAVVLGQGELLEPEDLPESLLETPAATGELAGAAYHDAVNRVKRQLILEAVTTASGNITLAAERLGLHANHLHRLIRNFDLRDELRLA